MLASLTPTQLSEWRAILDYMPDVTDDSWQQTGTLAATVANSISGAVSVFLKSKPDKRDSMKQLDFIPMVKQAKKLPFSGKRMAKQLRSMTGV